MKSQMKKILFNLTASILFILCFACNVNNKKETLTIDYQNDPKEKIACYLFNEKYDTDFKESDFKMVCVSKAGNDTMFELFCTDPQTNIEFRINYSLTKQRIYDEYAQVLFYDDLQSIKENFSEFSDEILSVYYKYEITDADYSKVTVHEYLSDSDTALILETDIPGEEALELTEAIKAKASEYSLKIVLKCLDQNINIL